MTDIADKYISNGIHVVPARDENEHYLAVSGTKNDFEGVDIGNGVKKARYTAYNAEVMRSLFPWTRPSSVLRKKCSIGCGDRLGLATRFHAEVFKKFDASPVFAQQSVRELTLTHRTFRSVVDDASFQVFETGFDMPFGADGDHLKSFDHIRAAIAAGVTMLTLDLSDKLHPEFASMDGGELDIAYTNLPESLRTRLEETYSSKMHQTELKRCGAIYTDALEFAAEVGKMLGDKVDLEISIDETSAPTLPEHHFFVVNELLYRNVKFESLAPRFIGEFQKGVDYIGDLEEFKRQFAVHADIARAFASYKISVHSGSDKFAVFPTVGKLTLGRFHLKTAGTSWLEALKAIAISEPALFRKIYAASFEALPDALKLYHITADFSVLPKAEEIAENKLITLLDPDNVPGRQLLHITYGAMLGANKNIRDQIFAAINAHENVYADLIDAHFTKHLSLLGVPVKA